MSRPKVIFLGNGPLAEYALPVLAEKAEIVFHAREKADLEEVSRLKKQYPEAFAVLASFGVMIPGVMLEEFEPEGILNLHPSLLPKYRGASPIESAIMAGDTEFGYSVMKLVKKMDAGPIYHQEIVNDLPLEKDAIYCGLARHGASWICEHLAEMRDLAPIPQDDKKATYTEKFDKTTDSELRPNEMSAEQIQRQIIAFQGFPKPKYQFFGRKCIILESRFTQGGIKDDLQIKKSGEHILYTKKRLFLACRDGSAVEILRLQPEGKRPMDAMGFINGYAK